VATRYTGKALISSTKKKRAAPDFKIRGCFVIGERLKEGMHCSDLKSYVAHRGLSVSQGLPGFKVRIRLHLNSSYKQNMPSMALEASLRAYTDYYLALPPGCRFNLVPGRTLLTKKGNIKKFF
jgi:hypothetical protein